MLIGVNKNTARQEFQRIENIEVELKTSDSNPQQIQGIVRLYATQPFADNLPDVRHDFRLCTNIRHHSGFGHKLMNIVGRSIELV